MTESKGFTLEWTFFLRASSERACQEILNGVSELAEYTITLVSLERYWKDQAVDRVMATTALKESEIAAVIFETLRLCRKVALRWTIVGPMEYAGGTWNFHGHAQGRDLSALGVEIADFLLRQAPRTPEQSAVPETEAP